MKTRNLAITIAPLLLALVYGAQAQSPAADNTKANQSDRAQGAMTADQQKNSTSDIDIAARIRRAVVADKSLSTYGHNVKIISAGGMVTLKGVVHNDQEKHSIEAKAAEVVGADHVANQLTITTDK
jgi:hyperosmotically inducible protein